jgi:hypothetical protein
MTEATKPQENSSETNAFDVRAALNKAGFAEFLAEHPDAESLDMNDEAVLQKRFEVFEIKAKVTENIAKVYSGHIKEEIGIDIGSEGAKSVKEYIDKQAIENPENVVAMNGKLDLFFALPAEIAGLEGELAKLGNIDEHRKKKDDLETIKKTIEDVTPTIGSLKYQFKRIVSILSFGKAGEFEGKDISYLEQARKRLDTLYGDGKKLSGKAGREKLVGASEAMGKEIADLQEILNKIATAEQLKTIGKAGFDRIRKELIGSIDDVKAVTELVKKKAVSEFNKLAEATDLAGLQKAQTRLDEFKAASADENVGINPLSEKEISDFQEYIDESINDNLPLEVMSVIKKTDLGSNALTKMEKSLKPFLEANKLGTREGDEARQLIQETLENASKDLPTDNSGKAKRLIINRILFDLRNV